ncbi:hypothetical protein OV203_46680 [Nannocystis sp. ILAH1]|uniref:hypothetical protein n=1 Tax=Nannocystis sp. ILAH1 TaxID=2996789 RepID=UPI0022708F9B|nr:hypothetical protein [Nannocystis sp. ILAH1]MCY0994701.1 hypothetical protein [Nannocystis sp. ILAH1]
MSGTPAVLVPLALAVLSSPELELVVPLMLPLPTSLPPAVLPADCASVVLLAGGAVVMDGDEVNPVMPGESEPQAAARAATATSESLRGMP